MVESPISRPDDRLAIESFSFAVRLNSMFFPLSVEELTPGLEQLGYSVSEELQRVLAPGLRPSGARVLVGGHVGIKAEPPLRMRVDMDKGVFGIDGRNVDEVVQDFRELEQWMNKTHDLVLSEEARFYEFILAGTLTVGRDRNPIETISHLFSDSNYRHRISEVVGRDVTNYGVRIVESGSEPTADRWLDIRIEPSVQRSHSAYTVNIVFRAPEFEEVEVKARDLPSMINSIVSSMESK